MCSSDLDLIQELKEEGKTIFFSTHILSDAETLCDRVAVVNKGELKGIGSIAELKSRATGRSEILWEGTPQLDDIASRALDVHRTAEFWRAVIEDENVYFVLDAIRRNRGRLISVTPIRETLEDYFFERLNAEEVKQ